MSTKIKTIKGSYHEYVDASFTVEHEDAELHLIRFFNGVKRGTNIQLTVSQQRGYGTSYIHLTKEQCEELAKALLECFDYNKYPSE